MKPWRVCVMPSQSQRSTGVRKPCYRCWLCKGVAWVQEGSLHKLMQRKSIWTLDDPRIIQFYSSSALPEYEDCYSWAGSAYSHHRCLCTCGIINLQPKNPPIREKLPGTYCQWLGRIPFELRKCQSVLCQGKDSPSIAFALAMNSWSLLLCSFLQLWNTFFREYVSSAKSLVNYRHHFQTYMYKSLLKLTPSIIKTEIGF